MKASTLTLALAHAMVFQSAFADWKCCSGHVETKSACGGGWSSCCSSSSNAASGHGCDNNNAFPIGRDVTGFALVPGRNGGTVRQYCGDDLDAITYCYTG